MLRERDVRDSILPDGSLQTLLQPLSNDKFDVKSFEFSDDIQGADDDLNEFYRRDSPWNDDKEHEKHNAYGSSMKYNSPLGYSVTQNHNLDERKKEAQTWDLIHGPDFWEGKESSFDNILNYSDLTLSDEEENGLLTDRIIAACSYYITRSPASRCHIVAKLCLNNKNLRDIRIIAYHPFLQYVDLSNNNIMDLSPLGSLPHLNYLDVSRNKLEEVLRFKAPWNLTYVNYSYNQVWRIDDLSDFWSLTYLDLSHNNISKIQGLNTLRYLRHLNLSYNKIGRVENLDNCNILELNLDHNIISNFEVGEKSGLKTLLDLKTLCLNNNLIVSLSFLKGVYHLRKLELRGNRITDLVELGHMKSLKRLWELDLVGNPVCEYKMYRNHLMEIMPELIILDGNELDLKDKMSHCREICMGNGSGTGGFLLEAAKNSARMMLLEQLNTPTFDLDVVPIDQTSHPLVILVGPSSTGKKVLISKLAEKYPNKIFIGKLYTTSDIVEKEEPLLIKIKREEFYEKVKNGKFYCVMEKLGNLYGFSKEMLGLAVKSHKLCLTFMDLTGALTIHKYGIQPYLVLCVVSSEREHEERLRKIYGPVVTLFGATHVGKRELANSHASNVRRIQDILYDVIEQVVVWVEERAHICFSRFSDRSESEGSNSGINNSVKALPSVENNVSTTTKLQPSSAFSRPSKFECMTTCTPTTCGLQEKYKELAEMKENVAGDQSVASSRSNNYEEDIVEEESGTCSTSYSAVAPPMGLKANSYDDGTSCVGEDDIFADWSSPFIDWDEIRKDPVALEEAAEELCRNFVNRVLATREIYQTIHLENPGLFSIVLLTDNMDEALENLTEFLKDVWRNVPSRNPIFNVENDEAYQLRVRTKLERFKNIFRSAITSKVDEVRDIEEKFATIHSPRSIVAAMRKSLKLDPVESD